MRKSLGYSQYQNRCVRTSIRNDSVADQRRFLTKFKHLNKIRAGDIFRDLASSVILMVTCALVYLIDEKLYPNALKFVDPILALTSIIIVMLTSINLSKKLGLTLLQGEYTFIRILNVVQKFLYFISSY